MNAPHIIEELSSIKGGDGSGNHGHRGRPGKRGGSLPRGARTATSTTKEPAIEKVQPQATAPSANGNPARIVPEFPPNRPSFVAQTRFTNAQHVEMLYENIFVQPSNYVKTPQEGMRVIDFEYDESVGGTVLRDDGRIKEIHKTTLMMENQRTGAVYPIERTDTMRFGWLGLDYRKQPSLTRDEWEQLVDDVYTEREDITRAKNNLRDKGLPSITTKIRDVVRYEGDEDSMAQLMKIGEFAISGVHGVDQRIGLLPVLSSPLGNVDTTRGFVATTNPPDQDALEYSVDIAQRMWIAEETPKGRTEDELMTFVHEFGHFIDFTGLGVTYDPAKDTKKIKISPATAKGIENWKQAVANSRTIQRMQKVIASGKPEKRPVPGGGEWEIPVEHYKYLTMPQEIWARSYAQYIATRSQEEPLLAALHRYQSRLATLVGNLPIQWDDDEFEPIASAIDEILIGAGWSWAKTPASKSLKGGAGSGHFEHAGRPGEVGGSASSGRNSRQRYVGAGKRGQAERPIENPARTVPKTYTPAPTNARRWLGKNRSVPFGVIQNELTEGNLSGVIDKGMYVFDIRETPGVGAALVQLPGTFSHADQKSNSVIMVDGQGRERAFPYTDFMYGGNAASTEALRDSFAVSQDLWDKFAGNYAKEFGGIADAKNALTELSVTHEIDEMVRYEGSNPATAQMISDASNVIASIHGIDQRIGLIPIESSALPHVSDYMTGGAVMGLVETNGQGGNHEYERNSIKKMWLREAKETPKANTLAAALGGGLGSDTAPSAEQAMATYVHEFGHAIDFTGLGVSRDTTQDDLYASYGKPLPRNGLQQSDELKRAVKSFKSAVTRSKTIDNLGMALTSERYRQVKGKDGVVGTVDTDHYKYLLEPSEVWARAYMQYVGVRSQDPRLLSIINQTNAVGVETHGGIAIQWEDAEFAPIADAIDQIFIAAGWMERAGGTGKAFLTAWRDAVKGGGGSGNHGHRGRPGKRGGSLPRNGVAAAETATSAAKEPQIENPAPVSMTMAEVHKLLLEKYGYKEPRGEQQVGARVARIVSLPSGGYTVVDVGTLLEGVRHENANGTWAYSVQRNPAGYPADAQDVVVESDPIGGEYYDLFGSEIIKEAIPLSQWEALIAEAEQAQIPPTVAGMGMVIEFPKPPKKLTLPENEEWTDADMRIVAKRGQEIARYESVEKALKSIETIHEIPRMVRLPLVHEDLAGTDYGGYYRAGDKIVVGTQADVSDPEQVAIHEFGHFLDHDALNIALGRFGTDAKQWSDHGRVGKAIQRWQKVVMESALVKDLLARKEMERQAGKPLWDTMDGTSVIDYYLKPAELWARAYSQYISIRSDVPYISEGISKRRHNWMRDKQGGYEQNYAKNRSEKQYPRSQWEDYDFSPIFAATDDLFMALGWLKKAPPDWSQKIIDGWHSREARKSGDFSSVKGGTGSGNHGHRGRIGKRGGSMPRNAGAAASTASAPAKEPAIENPAPEPEATSLRYWSVSDARNALEQKYGYRHISSITRPKEGDHLVRIVYDDSIGAHRLVDVGTLTSDHTRGNSKGREVYDVERNMDGDPAGTFSRWLEIDPLEENVWQFVGEKPIEGAKPIGAWERRAKAHEQRQIPSIVSGIDDVVSFGGWTKGVLTDKDRAAQARVEDMLGEIEKVHAIPEMRKITYHMEDHLPGGAGGNFGGVQKQINIRVGDSQVQGAVFAHEFGHFLDHDALNVALRPYVPGMTAKHWYADAPVGKAIERWKELVARSAVVRDLMRRRELELQQGKPIWGGDDPANVNETYVTYLLSPQELWARAYMQYIGAKTGNAEITRYLESRTDQPLLDAGTEVYYSDLDRTAVITKTGQRLYNVNTQWSAEAFKPIEAAMDDIFGTLGWLNIAPSDASQNLIDWWHDDDYKAGKSLRSVKGGSGSGNHGHAGRPGKRGGSAPRNGGAGAATGVSTSKQPKTAPAKVTKVPRVEYPQPKPKFEPTANMRATEGKSEAQKDRYFAKIAKEHGLKPAGNWYDIEPGTHLYQWEEGNNGAELLYQGTFVSEYNGGASYELDLDGRKQHISAGNGSRPIFTSDVRDPAFMTRIDMGDLSQNIYEQDYPRKNNDPLQGALDELVFDMAGDRDLDTYGVNLPVTQDVSSILPDTIPLSPQSGVGDRSWKQAEQVIRDATDQISKVHGVPVAMQKYKLPVKVFDNSGDDLVDGTVRGYMKCVDHTIVGLNNVERVGIHASGETIAATFVHEFGHALDMSVLGVSADRSRLKPQQRPPGSSRAIEKWMKAVSESRWTQAMRANYHRQGEEVALFGETAVPAYDDVIDYLASPQELWARSYFQYVAKQSGDPVLLDRVRMGAPSTGEADLLKNEFYATQWDDDDFVEIGAAVEDILRAYGLVGDAAAAKAFLKWWRRAVKGGTGSGNHGHRGRPGKRGGSLPRNAGTASSAAKEPAIENPVRSGKYDRYHAHLDEMATHYGNLFNVVNNQRRELMEQPDRGKGKAEWAEYATELAPRWKEIASGIFDPLTSGEDREQRIENAVAALAWGRKYGGDPDFFNTRTYLDEMGIDVAEGNFAYAVGTLNPLESTQREIALDIFDILSERMETTTTNKEAHALAMVGREALFALETSHTPDEFAKWSQWYEGIKNYKPEGDPLENAAAAARALTRGEISFGDFATKVESALANATTFEELAEKDVDLAVIEYAKQQGKRVLWSDLLADEGDESEIRERFHNLIKTPPAGQYIANYVATNYTPRMIEAQRERFAPGDHAAWFDYYRDLYTELGVEKAPYANPLFSPFPTLGAYDTDFWARLDAVSKHLDHPAFFFPVQDWASSYASGQLENKAELVKLQKWAWEHMPAHAYLHREIAQDIANFGLTKEVKKLKKSFSDYMDAASKTVDGDYIGRVDLHDYGATSKVLGGTIEVTERSTGELAGTFKVTHDASYEDLHLDLFQVRPKHMSHGIAEDILRGLAENAQMQGINTLSLLADITIGRYAWAKYGFDIPNYEGKRERFKAMVPIWLNGMQVLNDTGDPATLRQRVEDAIGKTTSMRDLAGLDVDGIRIAGSQISNADVPKDMLMPIGKAFLLDGSTVGDWNGKIKTLDLLDVLDEIEKGKRKKADAQKAFLGAWREAVKGGDGSGNHGHAGRPGKRGGSLPRGARTQGAETATAAATATPAPVQPKAAASKPSIGLEKASDKIVRTASQKLNDILDAATWQIEKVHDVDERIRRVYLRMKRGGKREDFLGQFRRYNINGGLADYGVGIEIVLDADISQDRATLTLIHEMGHFWDYTGLAVSKEADPEKKLGTTLADVLEGNDALARAKEEWRKAVAKSAAVKGIRQGKVSPPRSKYTKYLLQPNELWARSYTQYIVSKSRDKALKELFEHYKMGSPTHWFGQETQWGDEDFKPIGRAIEKILVAAGWKQGASSSKSMKGGGGSGNHGHRGRPGKRGGSLPRNGVAGTEIETETVASTSKTPAKVTKDRQDSAPGEITPQAMAGIENRSNPPRVRVEPTARNIPGIDTTLAMRGRSSDKYEKIFERHGYLSEYYMKEKGIDLAGKRVIYAPQEMGLGVGLIDQGTLVRVEDNGFNDHWYHVQRPDGSVEKLPYDFNFYFGDADLPDLPLISPEQWEAAKRETKEAVAATAEARSKLTGMSVTTEFADVVDNVAQNSTVRAAIEKGNALMSSVHGIDQRVNTVPVIDATPYDMQYAYGGTHMKNYDDMRYAKDQVTHVEINDQYQSPIPVWVHEFGHVMDFTIFGVSADTSEYSNHKVLLPERTPEQLAAIDNFKQVVTATQGVKYMAGKRYGMSRWDKNGNNGRGKSVDISQEHMKYLMEPREIFARAYTQYIATKTGDEGMLTYLQNYLIDSENGLAPQQWETEDFAPVIPAIDNLFRAFGMLNENPAGKAFIGAWREAVKGGDGSGNHGHRGRIGKRGGSLPRNAGAATTTTSDKQPATKPAIENPPRIVPVTPAYVRTPTVESLRFIKDEATAQTILQERLRKNDGYKTAIPSQSVTRRVVTIQFRQGLGAAPVYEGTFIKQDNQERVHVRTDAGDTVILDRLTAKYMFGEQPATGEMTVDGWRDLEKAYLRDETHKRNDRQALINAGKPSITFEMGDALRNETQSAGLQAQVDLAMTHIASVHGIDQRMNDVPVLEVKSASIGESNGELHLQNEYVFAWDYGSPNYIFLARDGAHPAETLIHEFGHQLDFGALAISRDTSIRDGIQHTPPQRRAIADFWTTLYKSKAVQKLYAAKATGMNVPIGKKPDGTPTFYTQQGVDYLTQKHEFWARAYAQYIATKTQDKQLLADIAVYSPSKHLANNQMFSQWDTGDFKKVERAIDGIFDTFGYLPPKSADKAFVAAWNAVKGGQGSGNAGHRGRPGKRGGSLPRNAGAATATTAAKEPAIEKPKREPPDVDAMLRSLFALTDQNAMYDAVREFIHRYASDLTAADWRGIVAKYRSELGKVGNVVQRSHLENALGSLEGEVEATVYAESHPDLFRAYVESLEHLQPRQQENAPPIEYPVRKVNIASADEMWRTASMVRGDDMRAATEKLPTVLYDGSRAMTLAPEQAERVEELRAQGMGFGGSLHQYYAPRTAYKVMARKTGLTYGDVWNAAYEVRGGTSSNAAAQHAVVETLGAQLSPWQRNRFGGNREEYEQIHGTFGRYASPEEYEQMKTVFQEQYDITQAELKQRGIEYVKLYRGTDTTTAYGGASIENAKRGDVIPFAPNALTAWSLDPKTAVDYGGVVLSTIVPADRIFGMGWTGAGDPLQGEMLVMSDGNPWYATVEKFQPYQGEKAWTGKRAILPTQGVNLQGATMQTVRARLATLAGD